MITYMMIKEEEVLDFEDASSYLMLPLIILADILLILFQPIFYIIYKKKQMEGK